jgi:hypothetical protein
VNRIILLIVLLVLAVAPAATAANDPVRLTFDKSIVAPSGIWEGSVAGDLTGGLRTELRSLQVSGPIWHVRFDWIVSAGAHSFVARLDGTLNTNTGAVVMNGTVIDGWLVGAQVHEEGQAQDPAGAHFVGSIQIAPATA